MIVRAEDAEKRNRQLHVDLTTAQARATALESREVIAVEALKQAKDEHVQKLMVSSAISEACSMISSSSSMSFPSNVVSRNA